MKLTTHAIRTAKLPEGKSEVIFFDDDQPGLGLRLRESGSRILIVQYRIGHKQRRVTLGNAAALNLAEARKNAAKIHARVRLGEDPAMDRAERRREASETFGPMAEQFLQSSQAHYRPRSFKEIERQLLKNAKALHHLAVNKIARRDIAAVLDAVTRNCGAVSANRVRSGLSRFFSAMMQRGLVDANPVLGTARHAETSRDRTLTPAEIRAVWNAAGDEDFGAIVRLLLLTAQREAEIGALARSEIHENIIVLAPERTKNRKAHTVPLAPLALQIIDGRGRRDRDLIFGRTASRGFAGYTKAKRKLDERIAAANKGKPIPHWTLHDLRRTAATYCGGGLPAHQFEKLPARDKEFARGLGILPHVIESILNHAGIHRGGIAQVYQRGSFEKEKRIALETWATHVQRIVSAADNVSTLRRGA